MGGDDVTLGVARQHGDLLDPVAEFCDQQVGEDTIYGLLHRERHRLFPDEMFADLYTTRGRRSIPPSVLACVLVLQRLEGLSDREAADRFTYDARWRYACGVGSWQVGLISFDHSVLVRFRMRLEASDDPRRIFTVSTRVAGEAGLIGTRRVLDSAPLFDAVATMDTVTLIRSGIRGLLQAATGRLEAELRGLLVGDDDYRAPGKPVCDWDDQEARSALVDTLARDGLALLEALEGRQIPARVAEQAELLAVLIGQDLETDDEGRFRIARKVAKDRVISTVDPDARHGHKTSARRYDGFKGHAAVDPDSEIITDTAVGPANAGDADMTARLTRDLDPQSDQTTPDTTNDSSDDDTHDTISDSSDDAEDDDRSSDDGGDGDGGSGDGEPEGGRQRPEVFGDAAYGSGRNLKDLQERGITANTKVQSPTSRGGRFAKDRFDIDLDADTVSCPGGHTVPIRRNAEGDGLARFAGRCATCPLQEQCTTSKNGRVVNVSRHEALLTAARERQADPDWQGEYRATRPKVERKLAHMLRPGRRARRRGMRKVDADFNYTGTGINLARMARLGLRNWAGRWQIAPA